MQVKHATPPNILNLGTCLSVLYELNKTIFRSQQVFYISLFSNYHRTLSELSQGSLVTSQSDISRVMHGQKQMPWEQRKYYLLINGDEHLRTAVNQYLDSFIQTNRQYKSHHNQLITLVQSSNNLIPEDKQFILAYNEADCDEHLYELVYRMLHVAMREPIT